MIETTAGQKQKSAARTITAAAFITIFSYSFSMAIAGVTLNEIIESFSVVGTSQGLVASMMSVGVVVAPLVTPFFQGRFKKVTMLAFSSVLQAALLIACGLSQMFPLFLAAQVLLGMGGALADTYSNSTIIDVRKNDSARYLGLLHGFYGIGSLIAPIIIFRLTLLAGWRGTYCLTAVMLIVTALSVFFISRGNADELNEATLEQKLSLSDLLGYIRVRRSVIILLTSVCATAAQSGILMWIVRYMWLRFDAAELGAVSISAFWICATITRFCMVRIKVSPMKLFTFGALFGAIFLTVGVLSANPFVMLIMMGATGLSCGHLLPVMFGECASGYEGKTTFATSVLVFVMGLSRITVPLAMAYASAYISEISGMLIPAVMVLSASFGGLMVMREDRKRK